jgi:hypothetical protein
MSKEERFANTFEAVMRRHFGRHGIRIDDAAADLEMPRRRLQALVDGSHQPNVTDLGKLAEYLGPDFLTAVFGPSGVTEVVMDEAPITNGHVVLTSACQASSKLSEALEDGRIDHRERAELTPCMRSLIRTARAFLAGNQQHKRAAE